MMTVKHVLRMRADYEEASKEAEIKRAGFYAGVAELQRAGLTQREIAEELGLSHQRIHQILKQVEQVPPEQGPQLQCSFCDIPQREAKKVVAGPGVYICSRCVALAESVVEGSREASNERAKLSAASSGKCSFCSKQLRDVKVLVTAYGTTKICNECVGLCIEIINEDSSDPPGYRIRRRRRRRGSD